MAMLGALLAVIPKERIFCLHVDHGLRPEQESGGDADLVAQFCKKADTHCVIVSIPPGKIEAYGRRKGIGIEAAARHFRHKALNNHAEKLGAGKSVRILIAHTKNDALELALMRVLRGAGPAGLAFMPESRGKILRPLLSLSRSEIITYLKEKNIPFREDSTNTDERFLRNRIRHRLMPFLDECFPAWKQGLTGMAKTQSIMAEFLKEETQKRICWEQTDRGLETCVKNFFLQSLIIREEALYSGINLLILAKNSHSIIPKRSVIRRFCEGSVKAVDLGKIYIKIKDKKVRVVPKKKEFFEKGSVMLIKERGNYTFNGLSIKIEHGGMYNV